MPRIQDAILDCVIYLYPTREDAEAGNAYGGSGFLAGVAGTRDPNRYHLYAVSNRHVVLDGGASVVRLNNMSGEFVVVELDPNDWIPHDGPHDLAVAPIALYKKHRFKFVDESSYLSESIIKEENIGEGDEIFMVGRFINHDGVQQNLPTVSFGNIAMMPRQPILHPVYDWPEESFAIELRSRSGYSGSPVFAYVAPNAPRYKESETFGTKYAQWFLGVNWGALTQSTPVLTKHGIEHPEGLHSAISTGVNGIVPAWRLSELLQSDRLVGMRDEEERRVLGLG